MEPNLDALFRTIWGEARGEGIEGMRGVANVILNRARIGTGHPHFGDGSVASACLAPWQFSCHNPNDPNAAKLMAISEDDDDITTQCCQTAQDALNGLLIDNTNGATYYYRKGSQMPLWAKAQIPCAIIRNHLFFKNIP